MISSFLLQSFFDFGSSLLAVLAIQQVVHDLLLDANLAVFGPFDETCSSLKRNDSSSVGSLADLFGLKFLLENASLPVVSLDCDSSCHSSPDDSNSSSVDTFADLLELQLSLILAIPQFITASTDHNFMFPSDDGSSVVYF